MKAGTRLATRDGTRVGNAIIVSVATDNFGREKYFVETDFGNEMILNFNELDFYFSINLNSTVEPDSYECWVRDRDELRSRSLMAKQGTVDAQTVGSVPTVTANLKPGQPGFTWSACTQCGSTSLRCGCD